MSTGSQDSYYQSCVRSDHSPDSAAEVLYSLNIITTTTVQGQRNLLLLLDSRQLNEERYLSEERSVR
jgi:hypothetical protein